jgi:hypothetical protein
MLNYSRGSMCFRFNKRFRSLVHVWKQKIGISSEKWVIDMENKLIWVFAVA